MLRTNEGDWYSASDVLQWLGCAHRTTLDGRNLEEPALRQWLKEHTVRVEPLSSGAEGAPKFDTPAQFRGDQHEQAMLQRLRDEGRQIVEIARPAGYTAAGIRAAAEATRAAMQDGADVVFQATLLDAPWYGFADFLVRVDGIASDLGDYAYEVRDTKLALHATSNALIQMAHYGLVVEQWQGVEPPSLRVWLGSGEEIEWSFEDAAPYLLEARDRYLVARETKPATEPEPCSACSLCRWAEHCNEAWGPNDLTHVHKLTRIQRRGFRAAGIRTIEQLAVATQRPESMAAATFERLREQAQAQTGDTPFVLLRPQSRQRGLARVPASNSGDIYFDLEGDPFAGVPTLDYLWAYCDVSGAYEHKWAHDTDAERAAFRWFLDILQAKDAAGGDWHVYHYNSYELTSLRRVAAAWPDAVEQARLVEQVEDLIERRFVDLYFVIENSLRTQKGTTSLKLVEKLAGYDRSINAAAVGRADDSIKAYEHFILSEDAAKKAEILQGILEYNTHDVRATLAVHKWLFGLAGQLAETDLVDEPEDDYTPSPKVLDRREQTHSLRTRLLEVAAKSAVLPSGVSAENARILADTLEWHSKEEAAAFIDNLRLQSWALEMADPEAWVAAAVEAEFGSDVLVQERVAKLRPGTERESVFCEVRVVEVLPPVGRQTASTFRMKCEPGAWKIKVGDTIRGVVPLGSDAKAATPTVLEHDAIAGTFTIRAKALDKQITTYTRFEAYMNEEIWKSLMRLAESVLQSDPAPEHLLGIAMLERTVPADAADMHPLSDESASDRARRILETMESGLLPVQGPPGTGKTWLAGWLITEHLQRNPGTVVLVTANSHRVIDNVVRTATERLASEGVPALIGRVVGDDKFEGSYGAQQIAMSKDLAGWLAQNEGSSRVVGATNRVLAREEIAGAAALLVIDEAGQFTLADSLGVSQAAALAVALGDPQQLGAPIVAAHEDAVKVSLLEHLAKELMYCQPTLASSSTSVTACIPRCAQWSGTWLTTASLILHCRERCARSRAARFRLRRTHSTSLQAFGGCRSRVTCQGRLMQPRHASLACSVAPRSSMKRARPSRLRRKRSWLSHRITQR